MNAFPVRLSHIELPSAQAITGTRWNELQQCN
jgi:hypothetical protein